MSLLIATWVSALATLGLLIGAGVTAFYARKALDAQSAQLAKQAEQLEIQRQQFNDQRNVNGKQAEVLDLQAREMRESLNRLEHDAANQHRAQASRVLFWEERTLSKRARIRVMGDNLPSTPLGQQQEVAVAHVKNTSELPVSNLEIDWHLGTAPIGQPDRLPQLLPGDEKTWSRPIDPGDGLLRFEADLFFRDAAGVIWRRTPDGALIEQSGPDGTRRGAE